MTDDLQRIAADAVPSVLAAALDRARDQAVNRLADLLTDAIVAQALAGGVSAAESAQPVEPARVEAPGDRPAEALYAYGITAAGLSLPEAARALTDGAPLQRVALGDLELLVSPVRPDQLAIDEDDLSENGRLATLARGHDAVVRAAAVAGPVLPLRFGTVVPDEAAARRLLAEHAAAALPRLRGIGTAHEWGVKLVRRVGREPASVGAQPSDRAGETGTEDLASPLRALEDDDAAERSGGEATAVLEDTLHLYTTES